MEKLNQEKCKVINGGFWKETFYSIGTGIGVSAQCKNDHKCAAKQIEKMNK